MLRARGGGGRVRGGRCQGVLAASAPPPPSAGWTGGEGRRAGGSPPRPSTTLTTTRQRRRGDRAPSPHRVCTHGTVGTVHPSVRPPSVAAPRRVHLPTALPLARPPRVAGLAAAPRPAATGPVRTRPPSCTPSLPPLRRRRQPRPPPLLPTEATTVGVRSGGEGGGEGHARPAGGGGSACERYAPPARVEVGSAGHGKHEASTRRPGQRAAAAAAPPHPRRARARTNGGDNKIGCRWRRLPFRLPLRVSPHQPTTSGEWSASTPLPPYRGGSVAHHRFRRGI